MKAVIDFSKLQDQFAKISAEHSLHLGSSLRRQTAPSRDAFVRFDINFRLRTYLTIPEAFSIGVLMGNYQCFPGIKLAAEIVGDEGGLSSRERDPGSVHSALLDKAFGCLRSEVFNLPPLNRKRLLLLLRNLSKLSYLGQNVHENQEAFEMIQEEFERAGEDRQRFMKDPQGYCRQELLELGVLSETVRYGLSQLSAQRSLISPAVLGRAAMHEYLADGLLMKIEKELCLPYLEAGRISSQIYEDEVRPYFLAHRDEPSGNLVECRHAERMLSLLSRHLSEFGGWSIAIEAAAQFAREQSELLEILFDF